MEHEERKILGFQFEPIKKKCELSKNSSDDEELNNEKSVILTKNDVSEWCKCENCINMQTEKEKVCCCELQAEQMFELEGKLN